MRTRISVVVLSVCCLAWGAVPCAADAADGSAVIVLDDIGNRLQFDFYAGNAGALRRDLAAVTALEVPAGIAALKSTYAGFGAWKLAEILRVPDATAAGEAARTCSAEMEKAVAAEPKRAGLFALLSVCQRLAADLQGRVKNPLGAGRSRQNLEHALALAPRNPHALLIDGINEYERARGAQGDLASARTKLTAAATAFDLAATAPATDAFANAMSWGPAEAWAYLGRVQLELHDLPAARDAFERALIVAGDYREVQQQLQGITGSRAP
jgi:hypothetical protein